MCVCVARRGALFLRSIMPYYGVPGPVRQVFSNWDDAKRASLGVSGATPKKFATEAEARWYATGQPNAAAVATHPAPAAVPHGAPLPPTHQQHALDGVAANELALFTDGACKNNQFAAHQRLPAGWGVAVVRGVQPGAQAIGGQVVAAFFGPVVIDPSHPAFLGAESGTNNTGELSAICEALYWLIHEEQTRAPAVICYDSEYGAKQTQGLWRANKNKQLVACAQDLLAQVRASGRSVRFYHVKGHSGHMWNDLADALANRGAAGEACTEAHVLRRYGGNRGDGAGASMPPMLAPSVQGAPPACHASHAAPPVAVKRESDDSSHADGDGEGQLHKRSKGAVAAPSMPPAGVGAASGSSASGASGSGAALHAQDIDLDTLARDLRRALALNEEAYPTLPALAKAACAQLGLQTAGRGLAAILRECHYCVFVQLID